MEEEWHGSKTAENEITKMPYGNKEHGSKVIMEGLVILLEICICIVTYNYLQTTHELILEKQETMLTRCAQRLL